MRAILISLIVIISTVCNGQANSKCDALSSLLTDSAVNHYLFKNADTKLPVAFFDVGNKVAGYSFPDCNKVTVAGNSYSIAHGRDACNAPCKCTRMFISATIIDNKLYVSVSNEASLKVNAVYTASTNGYTLYKKELEPVADWVEE